MDKLELDASEQQALTSLLDEIEGEFKDLESPETLSRATVFAHELPSRVRFVLNEYRLERMSGVLRILGHVVDQDRAGRTPSHWRDRSLPSTVRREEILLLLLSSLVGDPFGWSTQQDGRLIHDVLPIKGHEQEQLGSSSEALLTWHTEDAFHPFRGDFVAFACIRNPYAAATTVGCVDSLDLPEKVKAALFEERFIIRPDESHLAKNNSEADLQAFSDINKMRDEPDFVAILFGDREQPYIRADPYFMTVAPGDQVAQDALDGLTGAMDERMLDLQLVSGEYCFLDNFRVVHGRKPFKARHDGTDRWLKRVNVTNDLRKSRGMRLAETRVIG
jgi:Fe(II)/alpha-ketoglutarate-dependent arginine beta-hydroxylase